MPLRKSSESPSFFPLLNILKEIKAMITTNKITIKISIFIQTKS